MAMRLITCVIKSICNVTLLKDQRDLLILLKQLYHMFHWKVSEIILRIEVQYCGMHCHYPQRNVKHWLVLKNVLKLKSLVDTF